MVNKHSLHFVANQNRSRCRRARATKYCEKGRARLISGPLPAAHARLRCHEAPKHPEGRRVFPARVLALCNHGKSVGLEPRWPSALPATEYPYFHAQSRRAERRPSSDANGASAAGPSSIRARDQGKEVSGTSASPLALDAVRELFSVRSTSCP